MTTVAQQKSENVDLQEGGDRSRVSLRKSKDGKLPMPKLILHALDVNLRDGRLQP